MSRGKEFLTNWFRTINDGIRAKDLTKVRQLVHQDYEETNSAAPDVIRGPDNFVRFFGQFMEAFPDLQFELSEVLGDNDKASGIWTARGTHQGMFHGNAPTGRKAAVTGEVILTMKDGLMHRARVEWNVGALFAQLGLTPPGLPVTPPVALSFPSYAEGIRIALMFVNCMNKGDYDCLRRMCTPDTEVKNPMPPFHFSLEDFIRLRNVFRDSTSEDVIAMNDMWYDERAGMITVKGRLHGCFDKDMPMGPFAGYKIANKRFQFPICYNLRLRGSQLCGITVFYDSLELLHQLGAVPKELIETLTKVHAAAKVDLYGKDLSPPQPAGVPARAM